ncbi:MAG: hypothetical protein JWL86_7031 [Rhizobium sp.]|nr:hypothetical protein [Rhizobium sp.]
MSVPSERTDIQTKTKAAEEHTPRLTTYTILQDFLQEMYYLKLNFVLLFAMNLFFVYGNGKEGSLPESKQKPILSTGNPVFTADVSIVLRSRDPDTSFPPTPEFKQRQGLDTLRGFLSKNINGMETTMVIIDIPQVAKGKKCSFHFFFGSGDSTHVRDPFLVYLLKELPREFETTWNNRPKRAGFPLLVEPGIGPALSLGLDGNDAKFRFPDSGYRERDDLNVFPCDSYSRNPNLGKIAFELVSCKNGSESSAWSMNKGLMIEVHMQPQPTFPVKEHQNQTSHD